MRIEPIDPICEWRRGGSNVHKRTLKGINGLIRETAREPFAGIGKPEPLKYALAGYWSRRITDDHRMVYRPETDALLIAQLRNHY